MLVRTSVINEKVTVYARSPSGNSGEAEPDDITLFINGEIDVDLPIDFRDYGEKGLYSFSFVPLVTGEHALYAYGQVLAHIDVQTRSLSSFLQNLEDEALGSWQWDKTGGTLVMLRQDGTDLAHFTVTDDLTSSSRERNQG